MRVYVENTIFTFLFSSCSIWVVGPVYFATPPDPGTVGSRYNSTILLRGFLGGAERALCLTKYVVV